MNQAGGATRERVSVLAWVTPAVRDELERLARKHDRSMGAELRLALRAHFERAAARDSASRTDG